MKDINIHHDKIRFIRRLIIPPHRQIFPLKSNQRGRQPNKRRQQKLAKAKMLALQLLIPSSAIFASHSRTMTALRSFKSSASSSEVSDEAPTIAALLSRSQKLRQQLYGSSSNNNESLPSFLSDTSQLAYPSSSYMMKPDARVQSSSKFAKTVERGYCNWLLPRRIMIGVNIPE